MKDLDSSDTASIASNYSADDFLESSTYPKDTKDPFWPSLFESGSSVLYFPKSGETLSQPDARYEPFLKFKLSKGAPRVIKGRAL